MTRIRFKLYTPLAWVVVLMLAVPWTAFADTLITDGDGAAPLAVHILDFGSVCAGTTTTKPVLLGISRNGNYGTSQNVFVNGAIVTISVGTITGTGLSANGGGSITLPSTWSTTPNNTIVGSVSSSVTLVAGAAGSFAGNVIYNASGTSSKPGTGTVTVPATLSVSATVVTCDTTPPVLSLPSNITTEATGASGAVITYTATATDANPAHPTVTCSPTSGSTFPIGVTTVNCSATDAAGNTATGSFQVTVQDTTAPRISGTPVDMTVEATGPSGAVASYATPTATDTVDGTVTVSCSPASGSTFPLGSTTVTCSATDAHGNTASSSFTITVRDTTAPAVGTPSSITAEATGPSGAVVSYTTPTATDSVGPANPTVSCDHPSGSTFPLGSTTVTCSATDTAGNTGTSQFSVTVQDTTAPVLSLPAATLVEATGPSGAAVSYTASASDVVDGSVTPTCAPPSGSTFPIATTPVNCSATDAHGNTATGNFPVTVHDTTPPAITGMPGNMTVEATGPTGAAASWAAPTATDLVDGAVAVSCAPGSGSTFPLGSTTVTCSATDAHGNKASSSFTVVVQDTTPPSISGTPANQTVEATGPNGALATFSTPTASDLVDGTVGVTCDRTSGSTFPLGSTTVTCSATDAHGNKASSSFTIEVADTTPPSLVLPADQNIQATGASGATATWSATASDLVDGSVQVSCDRTSGSTFSIGVTTVNCSATDKHGNTAKGSFTIEVVDTTPPSLTLPANQKIEATGPTGATATWSVSASDLVDGSVPVICTPNSGSTFPLGSTTVTCSATDAHGNTAHGTFTVTVQDTTPPKVTLNGISDGGMYTLGGVPTGSCTATDLVSGATACTLTVSGGLANGVGTFTFTASATDGAGNKATQTGTYKVMYRFDGFLQPINDTGHLQTCGTGCTLSIFKGGSTVPVKFQLKDINGNVVQANTLPVWLTPTRGGVTTASVDETTFTDTPTAGGTYRWDSTAQQYIYNWGTAKNQAGNYWRIYAQLDDGTIQFVDLGLR